MTAFLADIAGSSLEYANTTTMHPFALIVVVACGVALLMVPRRLVLLPCLIMAASLTPTQRFVVASIDFSLLRIIVLFAIVRFAARAEYKHIRWNAVDLLLITWAGVSTVVYTLQWGDPSAFINRMGVAFETLGLYFLFRATIRTWDDIAAMSRMIAIASFIIAGAFALEFFTRRNIFSIFGGVPEVTLIRDGRLRCQGAFSHPIIAGCFWASLLPLVAAGYWVDRSRRRAAIFGSICCLLIVFFTASSTPVAAVMAAISGAVMWRFRNHMGKIQILTVLGLTALHFVMRAPVWHLIARIDLAGGSTGYHRYKLVDNAIRHFSEWATLGTKSTADWGYGMQDVTVQYVLEGVRGGFLGLLVFVIVIFVAFRHVGRAIQSLPANDPRAKLTWAVGVSMWVHTISFLGVSYFGQITMIWALSLALCGSVAAAATQTASQRRRVAATKRRKRPAPTGAGPSAAPA